MPNVSVNSIIEWDNVPAASYQAQVQHGNGTIIAPQNPGTDPDWVDVPVDPDGTSEVSLTEWLTSQPLGTYNFFVRSVDSNGNEGPASAAFPLNYVAPEPPVPRVK